MISITVKHKQARLALLDKKLEAEAEKKGKLRPATVLRPASRARGKAKTDGDVIAVALAQDLDALKELKAVKDKVALKVQLLPKWLEVVKSYRESGAQHPFEPLVRTIIWLLDAEQIDVALENADFAIAQQQHMPDEFKRDLPTYVAEEIHNWAERQLKAGHSAEPYLSQLIERLESKAWLVTQVIVLSKIYKLAGMFAEVEGDLKKAEAAYLKCIDANPVGHGVKGKLAKVQAQLG